MYFDWNLLKLLLMHKIVLVTNVIYIECAIIRNYIYLILWRTFLYVYKYNSRVLQIEVHLIINYTIYCNYYRMM